MLVLVENQMYQINENRNIVIEELKNEKTRFGKTLEKGLRMFEKVTKNSKKIWYIYWH